MKDPIKQIIKELIINYDAKITDFDLEGILRDAIISGQQLRDDEVGERLILELKTNLELNQKQVNLLLDAGNFEEAYKLAKKYLSNVSENTN